MVVKLSVVFIKWQTAGGLQRRKSSNMGQVFILLLLFGGTADAFLPPGESKCNGTLESSHCSVTLGGSVYIQLMLNVSGHQLRCKKLLTSGSIPVFTFKKEKPLIQEAFRHRTEFFTDNGTLKISNIERNDSGQYIVEVFDQNGGFVKTITLELDVQDPVISVHLVSKCQFQGKQPVTCLPKGGDNLQYSWSLNKKPLQDSDLLSGDVQANNITLKPSISGQLVCSVKNNISEIRKEVFVSCVFINCNSNGTLISEWLPEINKTLCDTFIDGSNSNQRNDYLLITGGVLSALFILLMIGLAVVYKQKKKQSSIEDEEELTYANVRINHQPRRANTEIEDGMVEYGQVRFSERPRRTVVVNNDPSTYAQVRRDR
ncbi:uncharacterized protein ACBT44_012277 isoform 2-T2 [Syngnathus typhle]